MIRIPAKWGYLKYWQSGEWEIVKERLARLDELGVKWNPGPYNLFAPLNALDSSRVRVVMVAQDPYPNPLFATGHAFSIPRLCTFYPPSLAMMVKELTYDCPGFTFNSGDLTPWVGQGVLLWNSRPTCTAWRSMSHNWPEWEPLTKEVFGTMKYKVFSFFGAAALANRKHVDENVNDILVTSHPSPRGQVRARNPFYGSRIFSTINAKLEEWSYKPIDWRL